MPLLPPVTIYLSGVRTPATDATSSFHDGDLPLGLLAQPLTRDYVRAQHLYAWLGVDNGCFTKAGQARFRVDEYIDLIREAVDRWGDGLLFATARDVAFDWKGTLAASLPMLPAIRRVGAPAALVLQDGATPQNVPWDELDAIFIGGSTGWKVGPEARACSLEATRRRKWVHMGRVNSGARMEVAQDFGVGSADGTYLLHATELARATEAVRRLLAATEPQGARRRAAWDALGGLRSPSPSDRAAAVRALKAPGMPRLAADLGAAREREAGPEYRRVTLAASDELARAEGRPASVVRAEADEAGDGAALDDILGWLRTLYRRAPAGRKARDWSEYGALSEERRKNPGGTPPWTQTIAEFIGTPRRSRSDQGTRVRPALWGAASCASPERFMGGAYSIRRGVERGGSPNFAVLDGDLPVAEFDGHQIVVHPKYRRRGIASELVADLRERHPEAAARLTSLTPAARGAWVKAHRLIVERAAARGEAVPARVLREHGLEKRPNPPPEAWQLTLKELLAYHVPSPMADKSADPGSVPELRASSELLSDYAPPSRDYELLDLLGRGYDPRHDASALAEDVRAGRPIWVYRATDAEHAVWPGAYVTPSLAYARDHGTRNMGKGKFHVVKRMAFPTELVPMNPNELFFAPADVAAWHRAEVAAAIERGDDVPPRVRRERDASASTAAPPRPKAGRASPRKKGPGRGKS